MKFQIELRSNLMLREGTQRIRGESWGAGRQYSDLEKRRLTCIGLQLSSIKWHLCILLPNYHRRAKT